jgi:hypothetical protein
MTTKIITDMLASLASKTTTVSVAGDEGKVMQLNSSGEVPEAYIPPMSPLRLGERAAAPEDPPEGEAVMWMSDGTGGGSDGDIMIKITAGGVTRVGAFIDFSALGT